MLKVAILGLAASLAVGEELHPVRQDVVDFIRAHATSWTARDVSANPLSELPVEDLLSMLGDNSYHNFADQFPHYPVANSEALPEFYDSRDQWGSCIHPIRNQKSCGGCWAFASSEALSDRFCIFSGGAVDVVLSPQDMISCDKLNSGCEGGNIDLRWNYLENFGTVSDACKPYVSGDGSEPPCERACSVEGETYLKYKCAADSVWVATTYDEIKAYVMEGPLDVNFKVYEDFYNYDSGVYVHTTGRYLGGHAVKLIGWGYDEASGLDYWTIANSWGPLWGEQGYFRIAFGQVEVDDVAYGCQPDLAALASFAQ